MQGLHPALGSFADTLTFVVFDRGMPCLAILTALKSQRTQSCVYCWCIGYGGKHDAQLSAHGRTCPSLSSPWCFLPSSPPFFVDRNLYIWILQGEWHALSFKKYVLFGDLNKPLNISEAMRKHIYSERRPQEGNAEWQRQSSGEGTLGSWKRRESYCFLVSTLSRFSFYVG